MVLTVSQKRDFLIKTAYSLVVAGLLYLLYKFFVIYFFPFIIGLALAYLMQKPARFLSCRLHIKSSYIAAFSVGILFLLLAALFGAAGAFLIAKTPEIIAVFEQWINAALPYFKGLLGSLPEGTLKMEFLKNNALAEELILRLSSWLTATAASIIRQLPSFLFSTVITVVASCYIAKDFDAVKDYIFSVLQGRKTELFKATVRIITDNVFKIISGYFLLSLITFALLLIGLRLLKYDNFFALAAGIALVDLLPVLGAGTLLVPWSALLFIFGEPISGLGLITLYLCISAVRNFAEPKIVGRRLGIPPIVMLICIFLGLRLFGFLGMLLSVLSLVVIINLYKEGLVSL